MKLQISESLSAVRVEEKRAECRKIAVQEEWDRIDALKKKVEQA